MAIPYAGSSEPIYVNDPMRQSLSDPSDTSTRVSRYRAAAMRKVAMENPSADYAEQFAAANKMTQDATDEANGMPDAQSVNPTAKAQAYLASLRGEGQQSSAPMNRAAAFRSSPTQIDLNLDSSGNRTDPRYGAQGSEGMAIMQEFEPEAAATIAKMAGRKQQPMYGKINGKEYIGTPRDGVSEANLQKTRAEFYRRKVEEERKADVKEGRQFELDKARIPGQQAMDLEKQRAANRNVDPSVQADIDLKRAQTESLKQQWARDLEERKQRLTPQQQANVDNLMKMGQAMAQSGNQAGAAKAFAQAAQMSGMPMDAALIAEIAKPSQQQRSSISSQTVADLETGIGKFLGWWDQLGLTGSGRDRAMAQKMADAAEAKLVREGLTPEEAKYEIDRIMAQYNLPN